MKVEKLDHIHICVSDLESATRFFSEILGTKFCEVVSDPEWDFKFTMDSLGVLLVQPTSPESAVARTIQKRGEGISTVSFKVSNIEEAVAELEARGMRVVNMMQHGKLKEVQFHPKDAYGVMIELTEYEEEHGAVEAGRCR